MPNSFLQSSKQRSTQYLLHWKYAHSLLVYFSLSPLLSEYFIFSDLVITNVLLRAFSSFPSQCQTVTVCTFAVFQPFAVFLICSVLKLSTYRGKLFYRLMQQAVDTPPQPFKEITKSTWPKGIGSLIIMKLLYRVHYFQTFSNEIHK